MKVAVPSFLLPRTLAALVLVAVLLAIPAGAAADSMADSAALPPGADPALVPFSKKPRPSRSRNDLHDEILALLPWQGIYAAAGGTISPAWRVVVTSSGDLRAGSNGKPGASTTALVDRKRRRFDKATLAEIIAMADRVWREAEPGPKKRGKATATPSPNPSAPVGGDAFAAVDYGELLVIADGPQVFILNGQGPITRPAAAALIKRLQAEAAQ
jgi:hypothetical protein